MTRDQLLKLCPGSKLKEQNGQLIWTPPQGGGAILSGKKQRGKGDQSENQEPLFSAKVPLWLKGTEQSPWIIQDNKDGMRFYSPGWRMSWVRFLNAGEECVTSYARDGLIEHCTFQGDSNSDKCIQANLAHGLTIRHCHFYRFITGIQAGLTKYAKKSHTTTVEHCSFISVQTPIRAVVGTVIESNNAYGAKGRNATDNGGRIKHYL